MKFRSATSHDVSALIDFPQDPGVSELPRDQVREDFEAGRMRPQWSWVVEEDGRLLGRALWWGRGDDGVPRALDTLDVLPEVGNQRSVAVELLGAGHAEVLASGASHLPVYTVRVPVGWRDDAQAIQSVTWRCEAAAAVGLSNSLERRQYAWTPDARVPRLAAGSRFDRVPTRSSSSCSASQLRAASTSRPAEPLNPRTISRRPTTTLIFTPVARGSAIGGELRSTTTAVRSASSCRLPRCTTEMWGTSECCRAIAVRVWSTTSSVRSRESMRPQVLIGSRRPPT